MYLNPFSGRVKVLTSISPRTLFIIILHKALLIGSLSITINREVFFIKNNSLILKYFEFNLYFQALFNSAVWFLLFALKIFMIIQGMSGKRLLAQRECLFITNFQQKNLKLSI
jgi:hypothetical protein